MGGPGSGYRSWRRTRPNLAEHALALDLRALVRGEHVRPGTVTVGQVVVRTPIGDRHVTIRYNADVTDLDAAQVVLAFQVDGLERQQRVNLTATEPHLGGIRLWFLCPITGRRAGVLYLPDDQGQFASREAYRLSYRSQSDSKVFRGVSRAQKVRARLGGDLSIYSPFPARPRGMHRRTYERLREAGLKIEQAALEALLIWEAEIDYRLSRG